MSKSKDPKRKRRKSDDEVSITLKMSRDDIDIGNVSENEFSDTFASDSDDPDYSPLSVHSNESTSGTPTPTTATQPASKAPNIFVQDTSSLDLISFLDKFKNIRLSIKVATDHYVIRITTIQDNLAIRAALQEGKFSFFTCRRSIRQI